jgi:hypothetical protein
MSAGALILSLAIVRCTLEPSSIPTPLMRSPQRASPLTPIRDAECSVDIICDCGAAACWRVSTTQVLIPTTNPTTNTMALKSRSFARIDRLPVTSLFLQTSLSSHPPLEMVLLVHLTSNLAGNDVCRLVMILWSARVFFLSLNEF